MIQRILIANRGEIVQRIMRTCHRMGLEVIVVYSEADKDAPYVRQADAAVCIGPANPVKSYLNIEAILDASRQTKADAVHPGYGFLSERGAFARAVVDAGLRWLGPTPALLRSISSKCYCRKVAHEAGVPVIPGTLDPVYSAQNIVDYGKEHGWPLFLKLDKGGGGKGIEKITQENEAEGILKKASSIGQMAFGSPDCYIESYIEHPRHIEVQFLADNYGDCVCLGERECSLQRRHQKIIEESPSSIVSSEDRAVLFEWTRKIVQQIKYEGAGTIEYLRSSSGQYYFLEINARLQVEHPVTEYITKIDIVQRQIDIANKKHLMIDEDALHFIGHAIESRVYAEDPETFTPSPGTISELFLPETYENVRVDHALQKNGTVPPYYDPLLCKVIVWENSRENALQLLTRTLQEIRIEGIQTTIPLSLRLLKNEDFVQGTYDVTTVDRLLKL